MFGAILGMAVPVGQWYLQGQLPEKLMFPVDFSYLYTGTIAVFSFAFFGFVWGWYSEKVKKLAITDPLTKASSRHYLLRKLDELMVRANNGESFCLVMFDLDNFKKVNKNHGHVVGDKALVALSNCVKKQGQKNGIYGRYSGDQFLLLCPRTETAEGLAMAEQIRAAMEKLKPKTLGHDGQQTISAAVYEVHQGLDVSTEELMAQVEQVLHDAKVQGRNRVAVGS